MTRVMIGTLLLFAAMVSPDARPAPPALARSPVFRPSGGATAQATATVRIVSPARFGPGHSGKAPGANRRSATLIDRDGHLRPAELLEFQ